MLRDEDLIRMANQSGAFLELSDMPQKDLAFLQRFAERVENAAFERWVVTANRAVAEERGRICKQIAALHDSLSLQSDPTQFRQRSDK